ncbi:MerR family transcriptional regulator [Psychrobacillus glaciei]|uniref:MerR family transcriptional regulator n=1 Tax=Psychrobacillus glaciei TaxID=2283160 RepID=A0A5J6SLZ9_9BACI|nr:MerR family transcriptional regulator [Psychrobacillus glaciei]QFF98965.1 MerR family transcriptional regulator [Psychrobacillus glaciei]
MYSIGNLANMSNSTVRTLRYYDEIGLLTPSYLSDGGHRYYEEKDVIKLHYIKVLKEMGFNLISIRQMLENQNLSHKEALAMQLKVLEVEKERIEERKRSIRYLLQVSEFEDLENWKDVFDRIPMNSSPTPIEVYEKIWSKHFSKDEVQYLIQLPKIGDDTDTIKVYTTLINDIRQNIHIDISSPKAQDLATRWINLLERDFNGNFKFAEKVWNKQKEGKGDIGFYRFEQAIVDFIEKAITHYFQLKEKEY